MSDPVPTIFSQQISDPRDIAAKMEQAVHMKEQARQAGLLNDNYEDVVALMRKQSMPKADDELWLELAKDRTPKTAPTSVADEIKKAGLVSAYATALLAEYREKFSPQQLPPVTP